MANRLIFGIIIAATVILTLSLFNFNTNNITGLEGTKKLAMLIVSIYHPSEAEIGKGVSLCECLLDDGFSDEDIHFYATEAADHSDGNSNVSNIEDGFQDLIEGSDEYTEVVIYISDNISPCAENSTFRFMDGNISMSLIGDRMDNISCSHLTLITLGNFSGCSIDRYHGEDRLLIASMGADQNFTGDGFDIARGLTDPGSDIDDDGRVTFIEAFEHERILLISSGQKPEVCEC